MSRPPALDSQLPSLPAAQSTNARLVDLWVHGKSPQTQLLYRRCAARLFAAVPKPIQWIALADLQGVVDAWEAEGLAAPTRRSMVAAIKSLFGFALRVGLLEANVAAALALPKAKCTLSQKILTEGDVQRMIAGEPNLRNRLILQVLYYCALRASSLCELRWDDLQPNGESGQLTVFGKGGRTYAVLLPQFLYRDLLALRCGARGDEPIFRSRKGTRHGCLSRVTVTQLVKAAAVRVGLSPKVSAHWLRHCHASHALDRGAPLSLVQQTLNHQSIETVQKYLHAKPNQSSGLYLYDQ